MKKKEKLVNADEFIAGKALFEGNGAYVKNINGGFTLRPDLLKNVNADAKYRWENGGKEIYVKYQADPGFVFTEDYIKYFFKLGLPNNLPF